MDSHMDLLGELASDAALERQDFIFQATEQLRKFLDHHRERIGVLGGLTLIDEEPDYLSIAPDLSFRSRSRYLDETSGEWVSETEVIESAAELIELYNPADIFAAFADAAREAAGLSPEPTAESEILEAAGIAPDETVAVRRGPVRSRRQFVGRGPACARSRRTTRSRQRDGCTTSRSSTRSAASATSRDFSRSSRAPPPSMSGIIGDLIIVDDDDERLTLTTTGRFRAEVIPEDAQDEWRTLEAADELVEFYDPTDVFGDLADAIAEGYPSVAPELAGAAADGDGDEGGEIDADEDDEAEDGDASEDRPTA